MTTKTTSPNPAEEFRSRLRARTPFVWVETVEELRAERAVSVSASREDYKVFFFDVATGARDMDGNEVQLDKSPGGYSPLAVFPRIRARDQRECWILRDISPWVKQNLFIGRHLRSLARDLEGEADPSRFGVVVCIDQNPVPAGLESSAALLEWPLPDRETNARILRDLCRASGVNDHEDEDLVSAVCDAAAGLPAPELASAITMSLATEGRVDPAVIAREKKAVVGKNSSALTWVDTDPRGIAAVGGLDRLKSWLKDRRAAFSDAARAFGMPAPRGALITGASGCGKSLAAKAAAAHWGLPLIRFDLGAAFNSLVGESQKAIRQALRTAEAAAPCVLWIDELEKVMGGAAKRGDAGTSADQLATLLHWQQERDAPVFLVATANDVEGLMQDMPELFRGGRFDAIFFVDLPQRGERVEILQAALGEIAGRRQSRGGNVQGLRPENFDLEAVADVTDGFSGAELAEVVNGSLFAAFSEQREITTGDLLKAAAGRIPLSKTSGSHNRLREWAKGRALLASSPEGPERKSDGGETGYGKGVSLPAPTTA